MMGPGEARFKRPARRRPGRADARPAGGARRGRRYSTALTMSSTTFFASPNTIIVLSM